MGGMAGWLTAKLRGRRSEEPHLALVERIALAPRQSLALVEAEGRRILVATSAEGGPAFYPLDGWPRSAEASERAGAARPTGAPLRRPLKSRAARVSW
jgi:hypothetical protein